MTYSKVPQILIAWDYVAEIGQTGVGSTLRIQPLPGSAEPTAVRISTIQPKRWIHPTIYQSEQQARLADEDSREAQTGYQLRFLVALPPDAAEKKAEGGQITSPPLEEVVILTAGVFHPAY